MPSIRLQRQLNVHTKYEVLGKMFDKKPEPGTCLYWYEGNECVELPFGTKITLKDFQSYERDIGVPITFEVSNLEKERVGILALLIYETLKRNLHDVVTIRIGRLAARFDTVDMEIDILG